MKSLCLTTIALLLLVAGCQSNRDSYSRDSNSVHSNPSPSTPTLTAEKIADEIQSEAKKQTVLITGKSNGTGIIIGRNGYTHYVLTSGHVVNTAPGKDIQFPPNLGPDEKNLPDHEDPYKVQVYNGQTYDKYQIKYEEVEKDSKLDLAIIKFDSQSLGKKYSVATLAVSPLTKNQTVYVYGFKDCSDQTIEKKEEFNKGTIKSITNYPSTNGASIKEGYSINYTNPTISGMSGSPVFDSGGRVVAIHGSAEDLKKDKSAEYKSEDCPPLTKYLTYYGNNYGIPMTALKDSSLASKLPIKLAFESQPIEIGLSPSPKKNNNLPENPPNSPIRFIRSGI